MIRTLFHCAGWLGRTLSALFLLSCLNLSVAQPSHGEGFHDSLSLQGFTGLLNTPNAEVTEEGRFYVLFSDQEESSWRNATPRQENYMFSIGLFSFVELGGRLMEAPKKARDLSANFKVKVPFIPRGRYLPSIAFGMQDVGGGVTFLKNKYFVASEELWRLRLSLGYGLGPNRMKGVFGGAEFKTFDWLYLLGEYDTRETNVGIRFISPQFMGIPVNLNATVKTSMDYRPGKVIEFGFGLQFPLGRDRLNTAPRKDKGSGVTQEVEEGYDVTAKNVQVTAADTETVPQTSTGETDKGGSLILLRDALLKAGFLNVRVGSRENLLVVEYENARYNHNELDGLGVVAGIAADNAPADLEMIRLVIRKKGIRILQVSAPLYGLREFLRDAGRLEQFDESLQITNEVEPDDDVRFVAGETNPSWLRSSLSLYPGLKTFVGTEVGVFDFVLSVKPDLYVNTWKGGVFNARWDIPLTWSENFKNNKAFRNFRNENQLERLMLFQAVKVTPTLMANLGAGMIFKDVNGTLNEVMWTPGSGVHRFRAKVGYAEDRTLHAKNKLYLGAYRYYFSPLNLYLEGSGGRFWDQDTGFAVEMKRFFGDTAFTVFYKNTRTVNREHIQVGGVQVAFPLTPRRDMKAYYAQLRGNEEWRYFQQTEIVTPSGPAGSNYVGRSTGVEPRPGFNLETVFYNRDRLTESYIRKHLLRLRDANMKYNNVR